MPVIKVSHLLVLQQGHAQMRMEILEYGVETLQRVNVSFTSTIALESGNFTLHL